MFKFNIPLQKGIELQPYRNYPMPVVRIQVHMEQPVEKQKMQELAAQVQQIIDKNRAQIQHWCNARRQEHSLNTSRTERKTYKLNQLELTHTIMFNQEIVQLDVYPTVAGGENDLLCLMVVKADTVYAIPMSELGKVASLEKFTVIYKKTLVNTNLATDPDSGLSNILFRQYKFGSSKISALVSNARFLPDRIRVDPFVPGDFNRKVYITPVTGSLSYSYPVDDLSSSAACVMNGDDQVLQLKSGAYKYTASKVTKLSSRSFVPEYAEPYAISADGICYFDARAGAVYNYSAFDFVVSTAKTQITDNMYSDLIAKYAEYAPLYPSPSPFPSTPIGTSIQAVAFQGVLPPDTVSADVAVDYGFKSTNVDKTTLPYYPYSIPLDPPAEAKKQYSQTTFLPVFSTGDGDKIDMQPYTYSGSVDVRWFLHVLDRSGSSAPYRDTYFTFTVDDISYSKADYGRDFAFGSGQSAYFRPQFRIGFFTDLPTIGRPITRKFQKSTQHVNWIGDTTDVDFTESKVTWALLPETITTAYDLNVMTGHHVSNGRHYIQNAVIGIESYIMCNGVRINSLFEKAGITSWNLMVMDVLLSRIKKFT